MSAYSLAHVVDVSGWPTIWGLEVEQDEEPDAGARLRDEVQEISAQLATLSDRLSRLQTKLSA